MKSERPGVPDIREVNERISKLLENAVLDDGVMVFSRNHCC
jgi:type I restriction enzyme, R subunit